MFERKGSGMTRFLRFLVAVGRKMMKPYFLRNGNGWYGKREYDYKKRYIKCNATVAG